MLKAYSKFSAPYIYTVENGVLFNYVIIIDNSTKTIQALEPLANHDLATVKQIDGIICPGFINTHCHLELSYLKSVIPMYTGLPAFVQKIMQTRNGFDADFIKEKAIEADVEMLQNGIVAVGDICNTDATMELKQKSTIYYYSFMELAGMLQSQCNQRFDAGLILFDKFKNHNLDTSIVPHATYSVHKNLLDLIKNHLQKHKAITTIHNQECLAENELFLSGNGSLYDVFATMGINMSLFQPTAKSAIQSILQHLPKQLNQLLVHNTFSSKEDFAVIKNNIAKPFLCTCPNANLYIENTLPNYNEWLQSGIPITIGTDSLASNTQLSIWNEIKTINKNNKDISLQTLLEWACNNGAQFLNKQKLLGSIAIGKQPGLVVLKNATPEHFTDAACSRLDI